MMGADIGPGGDPPASPSGTAAWAFTPADVTDEEAVAHLVGETVRRFGRVDGLVNAAGVAGGGPVHMVDAAEWNRVVGANLFGTFLTAKHVLAQMIEQAPLEGERGAIVTIASIEGIEGTAGGSAYDRVQGRGGDPHEEHGHRLRRTAGSGSTRCARGSSTRP